MNPEQRAAVDHGDGPMMVLAGAGTGKTRVLGASHRAPGRDRLRSAQRSSRSRSRTRRPARCGIACARCSARAPMRCGSARSTRPAHGSCASTATCVGLTRSFVIFDDDDQMKLVEQAAEGDRARRSGLDAHDPVAVRSREESRRRSASRSRPASFDDVVEKIYPLYQKQLAKENAVDFNDLLLKMLALFKHEATRRILEVRFSHVLVDEFQDTNLRPVQPRAAVRRGDAQPDRRRRRRSVDLRVARCRAAQPARFRSRLPRCDGDQARAQLPLDPDDPRRRERDHPPQPRSPREGAVDRSSRAAIRSRSIRRATSAARRTSSRNRSGG